MCNRFALLLLLVQSLCACSGNQSEGPPDARSDTHVGDVHRGTGDLSGNEWSRLNDASDLDDWRESPADAGEMAGDLAADTVLPADNTQLPDNFGSPDQESPDLGGEDLAESDVSGQDQSVPETLPDTEEEVAQADPWTELESLVDDYLLAPAKQVTAAQLQSILADDPAHYVIVDLRGQSLWAQGHIAGAVEVALGKLPAFLSDGNFPSGKPLLLVCHAGQQSAWAAGLANLMGFDSWSLQWGMPAWNTSGGNMWASACGNVGKALKTTAAVPLPPENGFPDVDLGDGSVKVALEAHANSLLAGTFKTLTFDAVSGSLDQYFILAHVSKPDYDAGHLPGAVRFEPGVALDADQKLAWLPPGKPILVYDCTGEGAAGVAAALNVLGYDAWFLKFGISSAWCSDLECAWSANDAGSYPVSVQ